MFDAATKARLAPPREVPALPVAASLVPLLPSGLSRGSTVTLRGPVSLLPALLGAASADGAWCALVGFGRFGAEALAEYGLELDRLALVPSPGREWTTVVGALLEAVDVVAVRPPSAPAPGDVRRLAARARSKDSVLVAYGVAADRWPGADLRLSVASGRWTGIGAGTGRLRARRVEVCTEGRGRYARPRRTTLWLPATCGGLAGTVEEPTGSRWSSGPRSSRAGTPATPSNVIESTGFESTGFESTVA